MSANDPKRTLRSYYITSIEDRPSLLAGPWLPTSERRMGLYRRPVAPDVNPGRRGGQFLRARARVA